MLTEASRHSLAILRDPTSITWYTVPLLLVVIYAYAREAREQHWSAVLAGLAFWGMDWFNEICNGLVLHLSNFAPVWGIGHASSYLILIGLNIEISFTFALMGLAATMLLPTDRSVRIAGLNNRIVMALANSALCVVVELLLHRGGLLVWEWPWWNASHLLPIFLLGYLPFFAVAYWVYDMTSRRRQLAVVASIAVIDLVAGGSCVALGWI